MRRGRLQGLRLLGGTDCNFSRLKGPLHKLPKFSSLLCEMLMCSARQL